MPADRARPRFVLLGIALSLALGAGRARAAGVSPTTASPAEKERAQTLYAKGTTLFKGKRFADAREAFRASFDVVASPSSRFMVASTFHEQFQVAAAYDEYVRAEEDAKKLGATDEQYRAIAEESAKERAELERYVGHLTVRILGASESTTVQINRRDLPRERWGKPVPVAAGKNPVLVIGAKGKMTVKWISVPAGANVEIELDLEHPGAASAAVAKAVPAAAPSKPEAAAASPAPPAKGPDAPQPAAASAPPPPIGAPAQPPPSQSPLAPSTEHSRVSGVVIVSGALGVAGLGLFGIAGAMNAATNARLDQACPNGACPPGNMGEVSKGRTEQRLAQLGLVVGVLGVGTAVTLFVIDPNAPPASDAAPRAGTKAAHRLGLEVSVGVGSIGLGGSF